MDNAAAGHGRGSAFFTGQETVFTDMIFPDQANHHGTLFAGTALSLLAKAAFLIASRSTKQPMVMAASKQVDFYTPVQIGQMVELLGRIEAVGRSSVTVHIELMAETLGSGNRQRAAEGRFVLVAVNDLGRPVPVVANPSQQPR